MPDTTPAAPAATDFAARPRGSLTLARARTVSRKLHTLFERRRQDLAAIAHELALMKRDELHRYLGYPSVFAYAFDHHGMGKSKVSELIGISEDSRTLPRIRAAFDQGQLEWTKAREIVKVAQPETELEWLARADISTGDELRAARKGEDPLRRRVLAFSPENTALFDQLVAEAKRELGLMGDAEAVLALLVRGAGGEPGGGPVLRLLVSECATCRQAVSESREGPVPVSPASVARARCSGEVLDLRKGDGVVKRAIPARIKRHVLDRDGRRCQVPRCRAMGQVEVDHLDRWKKGHDPARMVTLCWDHHESRHEGVLLVEGSAPDFRFSLQDGTVLGARHAAPFSDENGAGRDSPRSLLNPFAESSGESGTVAIRAPEGAGFSDENASETARRIAAAGLRVLGLRASEANRRVQTVLAREGGRTWTGQGLLRAALLAG